MHRTVKNKGFVVFMVISLLSGMFMALSAIVFCFYQGTMLVDRHNQLILAYSFLEEDFSCEEKDAHYLTDDFLSGKFVKKESQQKVGPYVLIQKTISHADTGKNLINRMEFVSIAEGAHYGP